MERHDRIAIVRAVWLILIGLTVAFVLPVASGFWMVRSVPSFSEANLAEFTARMSAASEFQFWTALVGAATAFAGLIWIAVVLSRWFAERPEPLASNGPSS